MPPCIAASIAHAPRKPQRVTFFLSLCLSVFLSLSVCVCDVALTVLLQDRPIRRYYSEKVRDTLRKFALEFIDTAYTSNFLFLSFSLSLCESLLASHAVVLCSVYEHLADRSNRFRQLCAERGGHCAILLSLRLLSRSVPPGTRQVSIYLSIYLSFFLSMCLSMIV